MLTRVAVENFKSFAHRQEARLSKITLIYGPNSAGKSSIIQALLLLRQTMERANEVHRADWFADAQGAGLVTKGALVDLGSFLGIVHAHDTENVLSLEIRHDRGSRQIRGEEQPRLFEAGMRVAFAWDPETRTATHRATTIFGDEDELHFELRTDLKIDGFFQPVLWHTVRVFEVKDQRLPPGLLYAVDKLMPGQPVVGLTKNEWESRWKRVDENQENASSESEYDDVTGLNPEKTCAETEKGKRSVAVARQGGRDILERQEAYERAEKERHRQIESAYRDVLERFPWFSVDAGSPDRFVRDIEWHNILHIGPVRHLPERFEAQSRFDTREYVGHQGEHIVQVLANDQELLGIVNSWLERLGIRYVLEALPISSDYIGDIIAMSLLHRDSNVRHSFRDVGYGISQIIPIVAQCFAFENVTLCIEQPELHIHPRLQAELGDLFIAATLELIENDSDLETLRDLPGNQFIIETHSEHLLLRIQRRIREGVISNEDVSVLYVDSLEDGTSTIRTLRLDTDGSFLDEWPGGFFEERFNELFGA